MVASASAVVTSLAAALALTGAALLAGAAADPGPGPAAVVAAPSAPADLVAPIAPSAVAALAAPAAMPAGRTPGLPAGVRFSWPLVPRPRLLRPFAPGPERWSPGHRGVDLAGPAGAPVLSAGAGVVTFAGPLAGRGVVVVDHGGGLRTTYEPVQAGVHRGDAVRAGEALGVLAATGAHCPPTCLHWGALAGSVYLDPLALLRSGRAPVLLPIRQPIGPIP